MNRIRALVNNDLKKVEQSLSKLIQEKNAVYSELNKFLMSNSKRIRSILCLLYLKANNIDLTDDTLSLLIAGELIHNASLIHDDIIDSSEFRRNEKSLYKKFDSKIGVLLGDFLLSIAIEKLININNPIVSNAFLNTTKMMSNAEIEQFLTRDKDITIEEHIKIIEGKTASLFSAVLKSTAALSGLKIETAEKLGILFGVIFQINNDLTSDSVKNDESNGIKTASNILGIEKTLALKDNYKEEIMRVIAEFPNKKYKKGIEDLVGLL